MNASDDKPRRRPGQWFWDRAGLDAGGTCGLCRTPYLLAFEGWSMCPRCDAVGRSPKHCSR